MGDPIPATAFTATAFEPRVLTKLLQKHTARVGKGRKGLFKTESTIAHPVDRRLLRTELRQAELLGLTGDGKSILMVDGSRRNVLREVARLRELTFRSVGEGTGGRLDLDAYDRYYKHLVIWDEAALEITGAYRFGVAGPILAERGKAGLYSASLFEYGPAFEALLPHSAELGRSFVQQRYWNSRALDQLWQGIGAFLLSRPGDTLPLRLREHQRGLPRTRQGTPRALLQDLVRRGGRRCAGAEPLHLVSAAEE